MYSCHYCEFQHTRFDSIVIHLVNLHPFRKISVDHITLCEVSGKFLTTNYSWPFNPSDVTSHYKILANDEQRNITLEPLCTEADDNSEIQENNTSPTQLEPHDHHTPAKMPKFDDTASQTDNTATANNVQLLENAFLNEFLGSTFIDYLPKQDIWHMAQTYVCHVS